jgi:predicted AlkP superfamily pyrophosphatase or phosphodiesterase
VTLLRTRLRYTTLAFLVFVALRAAPTAADDKPSLVVVISVDQMRADYIERFRPWFGKDGFNRFLTRGAFFTEARHRHAITYTGPSHAVIGTGLDPHTSGIVANRWYDVVNARPVYCAEDPDARWAGAPKGVDAGPVLPASPVLLDGASLGDRLKQAYPSARVVAMSLKDRAAVLMAGRRADAAIWFEERFERFVTSTYYPPHPELLAFDERLPAFFAAPEHRRWELSGRIPDTDMTRITFDPPELFDSKSQPSEVKPTFPHDLGSPRNIVSSPWGDVLVLELARHTIASLRLGRQEGTPDLLFVGLSSMDYYGHWFGPDSREVADGVVRLDGTLEAFFQWLDREVGPGRVLVVLTSDHGVQSIPEVARARWKQKTGEDNYLVAGRVDYSNPRLAAPKVREIQGDRYTLEHFLSQKFRYELRLDAPAAEEALVEFFEEPSFYVNRGVVARRGLDAETVKAAIRDWVTRRPGVLAAYTNTEIANGLPKTAPHAQAVSRSFRADRSGDVFVLLKPGWMWSYGREAGTTHGQPVDEDRRVPILAFGPGVAAGTYGGPAETVSIAKTVGALFGVNVGEPDAALLEPLLGRAPAAQKKAASR